MSPSDRPSGPDVHPTVEMSLAEIRRMLAEAGTPYRPPTLPPPGERDEDEPPSTEFEVEDE